MAFHIFGPVGGGRRPEGARGRIYATTDARKGALKGLADSEGYETFVVPDAVGGRYSVLTAVGLLPIAAAGIDAAALMEGPGRPWRRWTSPAGQPCLAVCRRPQRPLWRRKGHRAAGGLRALLPASSPSGGSSSTARARARRPGPLPASVEFTADLHSMGQYIQQGARILMETVALPHQPPGAPGPHDPDNVDGLHFLSGKSLSS